MAVYHLKVGFGSRAGGQSASAKNEYIEREGRYAADGEEREEEREHVEHGHMPAWAQDDPHAYWQAADEHERANGGSTARCSSPCRANWTRAGGASSRARSPSRCAAGSGCPIRSPSTAAARTGGTPTRT